MKKRLTKELSKIRGNPIVLTILPKEDYHDLNMHIVKLITKKSPKGAYVSLNKPYYSLVESMSKNKIKHNNFLFIDCIGREELKGVENCIFLKSPESLTNIAIALDRSYRDKEHGFIFLDSIDTLSVYHDPKLLIKFVRSTIERIRETNKLGMMIGLHQGTDPQILSEISAVCDKVINLKK